MCRTLARVTAGLISLVVLAGLLSGPAAASSSTTAEDPSSGVTFYIYKARPQPWVLVEHFAQPGTECHPIPAIATIVVGWSDVENILVYSGAGCTGQEYSMGTLRSLTQNDYVSFRAVLRN